MALDQQTGGQQAAHAITALWCITGNLDVPGGNVMGDACWGIEQPNWTGTWGWDELMTEEEQSKRIGVERYPMFAVGFKNLSSNATIEAWQRGEVPIRAAYIVTNNFLATMGAQAETQLEWYKQIDFIVVSDLFMTPTMMALADVVLPAATYEERDGVRLGDGAQRAEAINKVCQVGECKSDMEMNLELGRRLAPEAWPWENVEDMFTEMIASSGITFPELREAAPVYLPFEYGKHEKGLLRPDGSPGFARPRAHRAVVDVLQERRARPAARVRRARARPPGHARAPGRVPARAVHGRAPLAVLPLGAPPGQAPSGHAPRPVDRDPPRDVRRAGRGGRRLGVGGEHTGRAKRRVKETPIFDPRIVAADHGWWNPEGDPENLYDIGDLCINNLIAWGNGKSGFGGNYKTNLCKVYKMKEGE